MHIDETKCIGCANCVAVCPMEAIYIRDDGLAEIDEEKCVECHTCFHGLSTCNYGQKLWRTARRLLKAVRLRYQPDPDICPTSAIVQDELSWPRTLRGQFSDPLMPHESTKGGGRGTMEVKTNDVTNRVKQGEVGLTIEFGRPGVGAYFRDVDKVCQSLAGSVAFQTENPVTALMTDTKTGKLREDILNEKVLSCILEFTIKQERIPEILSIIEDGVRNLDTVVSMGMAVRCDPEGNDTVRSQLRTRGYDMWRAKINMGLGRRTNPVTAEGGSTK